MKKKTLLIAFLLLIVIPNQLAAVDVPAVVDNYFNILMTMLEKYLIVIAVSIVGIYSAWNFFINDNPKAIKNGIVAAILMAGSIYMGQSVIDFMSTNAVNFTGANSTKVTP